MAVVGAAAGAGGTDMRLGWERGRRAGNEEEDGGKPGAKWGPYGAAEGMGGQDGDWKRELDTFAGRVRTGVAVALGGRPGGA